MAGRGDPGDRYLLQRILGEGGGGRVWLVEDTLRPGSTLALKELHGAGTSDLRHEEELRREFATLACLHHPNLVEVHEFDTSPGSGVPRFTLEFIQGRDIVDAVAHEGPDLFMDLAVEALRALAFLHDFGLIHRDLKPSNLLVRDRPKLGCRLVLVDFGLSHGRAIEPLESHQARGTLPYMAPELFRNERAGARSDLYALGAVLHEAIHRRPPHVPGDLDLAGFVRIVEEGRRPKVPLPAGFPDGLDRWLDSVLSPDPASRPETAGEALVRLNEACGTRYPSETPASRAARLLSGPPAERQADIGRLWTSLDPAAGPRVIWLCGGHGSGKTRVLRWLEADAVLKGWRVATPAVLRGNSLDELRTSAAGRPTLLLLDELEESGGVTVDNLERLARDGDRPPLQAVVAVDPDAVRHPALRRLLDDTGTVPTLRRVDLGRLDAEGIRAMAVRATGGSVSEERVQWLLEASEGLPALAESLLVDGAWEKGALAVAPVPREIRGAGRLLMLSPAAHAWLEALAVVRRDAKDDQLLRICGLEAAAALAASEEAAAAGLAYRKGGRWQLESGSVAEAVQGGLDPDRFRALHRAAAEILETLPPSEADPWRLARLWTGAGVTPRAVASALEAAARSRAAGDPAEAAVRYAAALRLLGRDRAGRAAIRRDQADALMASGMYRDASRAYGARAALLPVGEERADALSRQAHALAQAGRSGRALAVARSAEALALERGAEATLTRARQVVGMVLGRLGREGEALPVLEGVRETVGRSGDARAEAEVLQLIATCKDRLGMEDARRDLLEAVRRYREARGGSGTASGSELKALLGLAVLEARAGDHLAAAERLERVRAAAADQGYLAIKEAALSRLASVAIDDGRLDAAISLAEEAADLALHLGDPNLILVDHARVADAKIRCGRAGEAVALLHQTLERPLDRVEPENADYARMLLADAWMESGHADDRTIEGLLAGCLERCRGRGKRRALLMALAIEMERLALPGCADPFEPAASEFERLARSSREPPELEILVRARLAHATRRLRAGDPKGAVALAHEAVSAAHEGGRPAFEARSRSLLSLALRGLGDDARAAEVAREGRAMLEAAAGRVLDANVRAGFEGRSVYAPLLRAESPAAGGEQRRLLALYEMIRALNSESDPDSLLQSILDMALGVVRAERGMILLKGERGEGAAGEFSVRLARNLEAETVRDAESYSRSIVAAAGAGRPMLALDAGEDPRFRDLKSVSLYGIRSLMCVPLRSHGTVVGTVYLDSRRDGTLFTPEDLRFLEAFADHAALALDNARDRARLERQNRRLQVAAESRSSFASLVGRSPGMQEVFDLIEKVAATDLPVLIRGETGTGKELVARAIHFNGPRRRRTFLSENCAAIPEPLLESELFGHVRGAFTGAERSHPGLFEQADGGTLFLDEVGDMSAPMQARLLRILEDGEVRRLGAERTVHVDVRVLAATHRDLGAEASAGRFREDLLYRLQVLAIDIPPLRRRPGDIALLTAHFLRRLGEERGRPPQDLDDEVLSILESYAWPGNVRELQNSIQRLAVLAGGGPITLAILESDAQLRRLLLATARPREPLFSLKSGEKDQIDAALVAAKGNRKRAAKLLGVSRATLYRKLGKHGI